MLPYLQHHVLLFQAIVGMLIVAFAALVLWIALRPEQDPVAARHRGRRRSWRLRHKPRHGVVVYHAHHAAADPGPSAFLGFAPDGDLVLVDDEHTHELVGAAA